jgi:hypothetical protein
MRPMFTPLADRARISMSHTFVLGFQGGSVTYFTNTSLRLLETASTKANTEFSPWWLGLNRELDKRKLPEARYGDARDYYETGHSPETAADDIVATR